MTVVAMDEDLSDRLRDIAVEYIRRLSDKLLLSERWADGQSAAKDAERFIAMLLSQGERKDVAQFVIEIVRIALEDELISASISPDDVDKEVEWPEVRMAYFEGATDFAICIGDMASPAQIHMRLYIENAS